MVLLLSMGKKQPVLSNHVLCELWTEACELQKCPLICLCFSLSNTRHRRHGEACRHLPGAEWES
jgi:hypothetical protein